MQTFNKMGSELMKIRQTKPKLYCCIIVVIGRSERKIYKLNGISQELY